MMPDESKPIEKSYTGPTSQDPREEVLNKLRADWQFQAAKSIKEYSNLCPQFADDNDFLLDLIYTDVLCREQAGQVVAASHYVDQFPNLVEAVERQLLVHRSPVAEEATDISAPPSRDTIVAEQLPSAGQSGVVQPRDAWPMLPGLRIEAELGRGGMGIDYKAEQSQLKRTVAVKILRQHAGPDDESLSRFRSEAEAIARLRHPNILQIFDSSVHQGLPFLVLEYIDGDNLCSWCHRPLRPVSTVTRLMEIVSRAVDYAHQQQIVHRDLKPANILLLRSEIDDNSINNGHSSNCIQDDVTLHAWQPKIADFGLAKQIEKDDRQLTRTQAILGTAAYLSPEQAWGRSREVAPTTDIHALGVILYELLTGHSPFQGVIVMLTGMGGETQPQGNYFYLPSDARLNDTTSLIPLSDFLGLLQECRATQKLLVFDTCQTVSLTGQDFPAVAIPDGVGVLLACSANQVSYEDDSLRHGVFSHYLLRALEGEGDLDRDRHIRLDELIEFTRGHVQSFLSENQVGAQQTPTFIGTLPPNATIVKLPLSSR